MTIDDTGPEGVEFIEGEEIHDAVVLRGILRATEKIRIASANLKNFHLKRGSTHRSIVSELRTVTRKGVRIEILHGAVPSGPFLHELLKGDAFPSGLFETRFCSRVHMKMVVVDYRELYMGTANFTGAGMGARHRDSRNFETGIVTRSEPLLDRAMALFDRVWSGAACRSCLRREDCPQPLEGISF